jgi:His/Glu/Gln/Arg/opine family amino acid ABC transporter permease subunit
VNLELRHAVEALPFLLQGALVTLETSLLAVALGVLVGTALTVLRQTGLRPVEWACQAYMSLMRGTPLFIQILMVYYVLPAAGLDIPRFAAGVVALSLNSGAYVTEILRGGLSAIRRGQIDAARAVGMPRWRIWRHILLPQTFVLVLPPLTVEFTSLLKASALLSVIAVIELTRTAQQIIAATFRPIEIWLATGALYFVMCSMLSVGARWLERRAAVYRA